MDNIYQHWYRKKHEQMFSSLVTSSLTNCDLSKLDKQIELNDNLKFLKSPAKDLPKRYLYLLSEVFPGITNYSLYDLIKMANGYKDTYSYFSVAGDNIVGWCSYQTSFNPELNKEIVSEIKMFSFDINKPDPVLMKDLKSLLDNLLKQYPQVSWEAVKENPANEIYQFVLNEYAKNGFTVNKSDIQNGILVYTIKVKE